MGAALGWGAVAASSLILGALIGVVRPWPARIVGAVLAFGAGALISAVSFDLALRGAQLGSDKSVALGLAGGALVYYFADRFVDQLSQTRAHGSTEPTATTSDGGTALALGAFLDGIPEQLVLGIGLATGDGVSVGLLAAIFVSNLPEAVGSATEMRAAGLARGAVVRLWVVVAVICTLATVAGYAIADNVSLDFQAGADGFAAGALLVMLIDSMIPQATEQAGKVAGLLAVLGFAVAAALSTVS